MQLHSFLGLGPLEFSWDLGFLWSLGLERPASPAAALRGIYEFDSLNSFSQLSALQAPFEILDRFHDPLLKPHLRFPAQHFLRAGDVRLPHLRVVHRQRLIFDLRFR